MLKLQLAEEFLFRCNNIFGTLTSGLSKFFREVNLVPRAREAEKRDPGNEVVGKTSG